MKTQNDLLAPKKPNERQALYYLACRHFKKAQSLWNPTQEKPVKAKILTLFTLELNKAEAIFKELVRQDFMSAGEYLKKITDLQKAALNYRTYHSAISLIQAAVYPSASIQQHENNYRLFQQAADLLTPLAEENFFDAKLQLEQAHQKRIEARSQSIRAQAKYSDEQERAQQQAEFKSLEYQLKSIYKLSGRALPFIRQELNQLIEAQLKLYLLHPTELPRSTAFLNHLLKKINKYGRDLPLYDLEGRKHYLIELESELNALNKIADSPEEKVELVKKYKQLDHLLEYNTQIVELIEMDLPKKNEPSAQFKADYLNAKTLHAAFSQKLKTYHEENNLLKKEKNPHAAPRVEFRVQLDDSPSISTFKC